MYGVKEGSLKSALNCLILLFAIGITYFYFIPYNKSFQELNNYIQNKQIFYSIFVFGIFFFGWLAVSFFKIILPSGSLYSRILGGFIGLLSGVIILAIILFTIGIEDLQTDKTIGLSAFNNKVVPLLILIIPLPTHVVNHSRVKNNKFRAASRICKKTI